MRMTSAKSVVAVMGAALLMSWPAIWNGFPLLYSGDSGNYLASGKMVAEALLHGDDAVSGADRSLIYGFGILPFHCNTSPWPVVGLNAALTAYVLWLLVRSLLPERVFRAYLTLTVLLCTLTGLGWYVGLVVPDILGPISYLAFYLLAFCNRELSRGACWSLALISWWALMSHPSHLLVATGLTILIAAALIVRHETRRQRLVVVGRLALILLAAILTQLMFYSQLLGEPQLFNRKYPFLLARVVTEPPGVRYLEHRCEKPDLLICEHLAELPNAPAAFLWDEGGIWQRASPADRGRLLDEEMQVVLGTFAAFPKEELRLSLVYFLRQLFTFGLSENARTSSLLADAVERAIPGARAHYLASRQVQGTLHEQVFTVVQAWTVLISLFVVFASLVFCRNRWSYHLTALAGVIAFTLLANAALTANISQVADRFQCRVIWLLPLLAGILVLSAPARRSVRSAWPAPHIRNL